MPYVPTYNDVRKKYYSCIPKEKNLSQASVNGEDKQRYYNTYIWKNARRAYLYKQPICELSLMMNRVEPASEVHHLVKWYNQPSIELRWQLLTDEDNLMALSKDKHLDIHYRRSNLSQLDIEYIDKRKEEIYKKYLEKNIIITMSDDSNLGE